MIVPLQIPGGPELLVIGLVFFLCIAVLGGIVAGIVFLSRRNSQSTSVDEQRVAALERRVEELEERDQAEDDRPRTNE